VQQLENIKDVCLMEFASCYTLQGKKRGGIDIPYVIRYVKYNKHIDVDSYYKE